MTGEHVPTTLEVIVPSAGGIIAALAALLAAWRAGGAKRSADGAGTAAVEAGTAAVEARAKAEEAVTLARPTGNGYAEESRAAWRRIDRGVRSVTRATRANAVEIARLVEAQHRLTEAHDRTRDALLEHLATHARPEPAPRDLSHPLPRRADHAD